MSAERRPSELARLTEVRRVGRERTARIAAILGEAFADDPLQAWLLEGVDPSDRPERRTAWWRFMISHAPAGAELHMTGDGSAAACWHPSAPEPYPQEVRAKFAEMVTDLTGGRAPLVLESLARVARRAPTEPHWHLAAVGVVPGRQSGGVGSRLMATMLARCDRLGIPAYLESSNARNLDFYRRLGFGPVGEVHTVDGRVALTLMWRPPDPVS